MGVNHLSHFALTLHLLPLLKKSAASSPVGARIVNVASLLHILAHIRATDPYLRNGKYSANAAYGNSKAGQVRSLSRQLQLTTLVHVHPLVVGRARHVLWARAFGCWLSKRNSVNCRSGVRSWG